LWGLSPCGLAGQLEILDISELAFDNYKETENYNLGGVKDQLNPPRQGSSEARQFRGPRAPLPTGTIALLL